MVLRVGGCGHKCVLVGAELLLWDGGFDRCFVVVVVVVVVYILDPPGLVSVYLLTCPWARPVPLPCDNQICSRLSVHFFSVLIASIVSG